MKKNILVKIMLCAAVGLVGESALAQGLLVVKKDGSEIRIPEQELNYVTVYEKNFPTPPETNLSAEGAYYGATAESVGSSVSVDSTTVSTLSINASSNTISITYPKSLSATGENSMTIPRFKITGIPYVDVNEYVKNFQANDLTTSVTRPDGSTMNISVAEIKGTVDTRKNRLEYIAKVKMGNMPMYLDVDFCGMQEDGKDFPQANEESTVVPVKHERRLKEYINTNYSEDEYGNPYTEIMKSVLHYDSDNRLISKEFIEWPYGYDNSNYTSHYTYTWAADKIIEEDKEGYDKKMLTVKDGKVLKIVDLSSGQFDRESMSYNEKNQAEYFYYEGIYETREMQQNWKNGRIVSMHESFIDSEASNYEYEFIYEGLKTKGFWPFMTKAFYDHSILLAHPELLGQLSTELPSRVEYSQDGVPGVVTFEYEFDAKGYVTKCIVTDTTTEENSSGQMVTTIYKQMDEYVWE